MRACHKRPVDAQKLADELEATILNSMKTEVSSQKIGELAMERLKALDAVAYVRFASVHREFKDIETFAREISELREEQRSASRGSEDCTDRQTESS